MAATILAQLRNKIAEAESFAALQERLAAGVPAVSVEGVSEAGKAAVLAALLGRGRPTALVVTYNDDRAQRLTADLGRLLSDVDDLEVQIFMF